MEWLSMVGVVIPVAAVLFVYLVHHVDAPGGEDEG